MTTSIDANGLFSPEQIINDLILSDEISQMRYHLREMCDSYVLSEDEQRYRKAVYATYMALDILLSKVEKINPKIIAA